MATRVQIALDLSASGVGSYFTLDDATRGVLDNTLYKLGGDVLIDVTAKVLSVQVRRGRSRQLERFTAGNANIVLDNRDRAFDPLNTASAYYGSILPGKQVIIDRDGATIYTGSGIGNHGAVEAAELPWHGRPASAELVLPPTSAVWLEPC
jgi:hypothetical protein